MGTQGVLADSATFHLHGIIRDSLTGSPVAGAQVVNLGTGQSRQSSSDGHFVFDKIPAGRYRFGVRRLGYYDRVIAIDVRRDTSVAISLVPLGIELHRIVVETQRPLTTATEHAIELNTRQLDRHRGATLGELIEQVPSVSLLRTGTAIAKPVIRGLHSHRIVLTTDGIQHQAQDWGLDHAPAIDPFSPTSIAIASGAASIEESYSAIGGIIRLELPQLEYHRPTTIATSVVGASNNGFMALSGLLRSSDVLLNNTAVLFQLGGHLAGDNRTPQYVLSNTGSRRISALVRLGYEHDSWQHEASYSVFATEVGILAASHIGNADDLRRTITSGTPLIVRPWTYQISNPRQQIIHHTVLIKSTWSSSLGVLEFRYGWQFNDRSEFDAHNLRVRDSSLLPRLLQRPAIELLLASYQLDARLRSTFGQASTTVGIHLLRQVNDRRGVVFLVPDYHLYEGGAYTTATTSYGAWIVSGGVRSDIHTIQAQPQNRSTGLPSDTTLSFIGVAAHIGLERTFPSQTRLQVNLATHWRPPLPVELFANDLHHGTAQFEIGNRLLRSERSYQLDVRLSQSIGEFISDLSTFANMIPRFIQLLPDSVPTVTYRGVFPTMRYVQRPAMLIGGECGLSYSVSTLLRLDCTVGVVRGFDLSSGEYIPFLPADRARITLHWHAERLGMISEPYIESGFNLIRRQTAVSPTTFDYAPPPAGYMTVDLEAGGTIEIGGTPVRISLAAANVFDTPYRDYLSRYRYFALDPGRNIIIRCSTPLDMFHHTSNSP
ncbi:MAG: TonB-dependent receptor [Chlorobi bacterium]|nr:TonB-dependent receptor [Chlorobiota bacterium]